MATIQTSNIAKTLQTIVSVKTIKGTKFVGVHNYTNQKGEVSNYVFNVGINYENVLKHDYEALKQINLLKLVQEKGTDVLTSEIFNKAYNELRESLEKRLADEQTKNQLLSNNDETMVRSQAQKDAYTAIAKGLKLKDNELYLYGLQVKKTVVKAIEYKKVNSQPKTIAKNIIQKYANFKEDKFKQFKLGQIGELKINGIKI